MVIESTALSATATKSNGAYPADIPVTRTKRRTVPDRAHASASLSTPRWFTAAGWVLSHTFGPRVSSKRNSASLGLEILCAPKHATTRVHPATAASISSKSSSVTSPRTISAPSSLSAAEAADDGSRVTTRVATPIERSVVTSLVPTRPAPPTTSTSSSASGTGRPAGTAAGDASSRDADA
jgi:hypothetical protein